MKNENLTLSQDSSISNTINDKSFVNSSSTLRDFKPKIQKKKSSNSKVMKTKNYDHSFKIVLIGDSGVGKSCILMRFADDKFNENFYATIGVDFRFKNLEIDGKTIKLQIWDTAGQERFKTITNAYYRGADAIIFVYDISDRNSFTNLKEWMDDVNKITASENPFRIILGNKCDLVYKKEVSETDIALYREQTQLDIYEISAKESFQIKEVMELITKKLIARHEMKNSINDDTNKNVYSLYNENEEINNKIANCC